LKVNPSKLRYQHDARDGGQIRRNNAEEAPDIKLFKIDALILSVFPDQKGADEETADCEERVDSQVAILGEAANEGWIGKERESAMEADNGGNCESTPSIQGWDVPEALARILNAWL
jgi:hypothetical protein